MLSARAASLATSSFESWTTYCGAQLFRNPAGIYTYTTNHMALDADGSLFAYHPNNTGRDDLQFASWPSGSEDWRWILVGDPQEPARPWVQPSGPAAGYFLSMTTLRDRLGDPTAPATYVDSEHVPYLAFPANFLAIPGVGSFGDLAVVRSNGTGLESWAVVADQAPASHPLGEVSLRLAENLGGTNVNPRDGDGIPAGPFQAMIFPGSRFEPAWPQTLEALRFRAHALFNAAGRWPSEPSLA